MDLSNRTDLPATFDERAIVTQFLRYARQTVHAKCVDLSPSDAAATPLPASPAMSVAGLVSHLLDTSRLETGRLSLEPRPAIIIYQ